MRTRLAPTGFIVAACLAAMVLLGCTDVGFSPQLINPPNVFGHFTDASSDDALIIGHLTANASTYRLYRSTDGETYWRETARPFIREDTYEFSISVPDAAYFKVTAMLDDDESGFSQPTRLDPALNKPLQSFSVIAPLASDLFWGNTTIQWLPRSDAAFYVVIVDREDYYPKVRTYAKISATQLHWAYGDGSLAVYALESLAPGTNYTIQVLAYGYQALQLGYSSAVSVTTTS